MRNHFLLAENITHWLHSTVTDYQNPPSRYDIFPEYQNIDLLSETLSSVR